MSMHREERIAKALVTLLAIERAVARDPHTKTIQASMLPDTANEYLMHRIDNAVRIYCASDVAASIGVTARE